MAHQVAMKLIPALLLAGVSGAVLASGFQLLEQGSGLGNAYAGSAAKASDASTIYWNPAGMTQLPRVAASGGLTGVNTSFKFKDQGSQVGEFGQGGARGAGDGGDAGGLAWIPNAYLSWGVTKDLYLGIGIGAPFGLKTKYDDPWYGSAHSNEFDIKTININPSIAFRVNDAVSLGGGLNYQRIEAAYYRRVAINNMPIAPGVALALPRLTSEMHISDSAWGWNAGALFTLSPSTKVGLSYRSAIQYHTEGDVKVWSDGSAQGNFAAGFLNSRGASSNVKANIKVPDTFIASVHQRLSDRWEMLGDLSWTGWSSIKYVDIVRTHGLQAGQTAQTLEPKFQDTYRIALGANYNITDAVKLQFGLAYDQTPVKNSTTRLASLPDNDRTWFTFGTQWKPSKEQALELGLAYLYIKDTKINNNQTNTTDATRNRGTLVGEYEANIWILGLQYSVGF